MRLGAVAGVLLLLSGIPMPREHRPAPALPDRFTIGRHTFFDVGAPTDYYELFFVGPAGGGTSIERITLTPEVNACIMPAKVEVASAIIKEPPASLIGATDPCSIPEKELNRELKRRKNYVVFSGADVTMQVQCGDKVRVIRSDILDRDMFDPHPNTPEHTAWTMRLLGKLDDAVGPNVMEKPVFPLLGNTDSQLHDSGSAASRDIGSGKYDGLFVGAPDKPSEVYRAAQKPPPPPPTVRLVDSSPAEPIDPVLPRYPPIARLAHVEGTVTFTIEINSEGRPTPFVFWLEKGPPLLAGSVQNAVRDWRFPPGAPSRQVRATIEFALNCHSQAK